MVGDGRSTLALQQTALRRALAARDPGRLHLRFQATVLEAYRGAADVELLRTRTVGRISLGRRWSLDVGIAPDGSLHVPFQDFVDRLPEDEWPRWIEHLASEPASAAFLQMRLTSAACIDDGETAPWA
jgi:hypothetical protein